MTWWTPDVWQTYTPTATDFTVGNGTLAGRYCRTGLMSALVRIAYAGG